MSSVPSEKLMFVVYQMLSISLTFSLVLMVNSRLFTSLEKDIIARRSTEAFLRASEEKFSLAFRTSPYAITITSPDDGKLIDVNEAFFSITGFTREEALSSSSVSLNLWVNEDDRNRVVKDLSQGKKVVGREFRFRKKTGEEISGLFSADVIVLQDQRYILSSISDITEFKQAEESLRATSKRLDMALHSGNAGTWDWDVLTGHIEWSPQMFDLFGLDPQMVAASFESWRSALHPEDIELAERRIDLALKQRTTLNSDYRVALPGGEIRWINAVGEGIYDSQGSPIQMIGLCLDITERKNAESEREKLEQQLLQSQKLESVGRLAGGVAHDFNNMLGAILGYTELVLDQLPADHFVREDLEQVRQTAQRSANLTAQLLAFARKQTIQPRILDLNETISNMIRMLQRLIGEDIDLSWEPGPNLWKVKLDQTQIEQVVTNLTINARDAIAGIGILSVETSNLKIENAGNADHSDIPPGEYALLTVSDNGPGMNKEVLEHLFEPFYTTKEFGKSTGLGLATTYGIIKQNNGFINVDSSPGRGTTFRIYLPREIGEVAQRQGETEAVKPLGGTETVLIVEDEVMILELGQRILKGLGYTVMATNSPAEAARLVREHQGDIHLLITDVVMPEMNGRDLANWLTSLKPGFKCLYMSGYTADIIAERGVVEDDANFIQKPFTVQSLAEKVREVLDS